MNTYEFKTKEARHSWFFHNVNASLYRRSYKDVVKVEFFDSDGCVGIIYYRR